MVDESQATAATRTVAAIIAATPIRRDAEGRYCLNDLHKAAGGEKRHSPNYFINLDTTKELVAEISNTGFPVIKPVEMSRGRYGGTYVVDDLALTYAMWVSPKLKRVSHCRYHPDRNPRELRR